MFAQLWIGSLLLAPGIAGQTPEFVDAQADVAQSHSQVSGIFLGFAERFPTRFVHRFLVRTDAGVQTEYQLGPTGVVLRNNQPARITDLEPGDRVLMQLLSPLRPMVARIEATGP
jgi:hypothetical protein